MILSGKFMNGVHEWHCRTGTRGALEQPLINQHSPFCMEDEKNSRGDTRITKCGLLESRTGTTMNACAKPMKDMQP